MNLLLSSLEAWRRLVMKSLLTHWITEETPARVDRRCCTFFSHPGGRGPAASAAARPTYQSAATQKCAWRLHHADYMWCLLSLLKP
jgi:hypothetical protein